MTERRPEQDKTAAQPVTPNELIRAFDELRDVVVGVLRSCDTAGAQLAARESGPIAKPDFKAWIASQPEIPPTVYTWVLRGWLAALARDGRDDLDATIKGQDAHILELGERLMKVDDEWRAGRDENREQAARIQVLSSHCRELEAELETENAENDQLRPQVKEQAARIEELERKGRQLAQFAGSLMMAATRLLDSLPLAIEPRKGEKSPEKYAQEMRELLTVPFVPDDAADNARLRAEVERYAKLREAAQVVLDHRCAGTCSVCAAQRYRLAALLAETTEDRNG